jgi:hypothetical protein
MPELDDMGHLRSTTRFDSILDQSHISEASFSTIWGGRQIPVHRGVEAAGSGHRVGEARLPVNADRLQPPSLHLRRGVIRYDRTMSDKENSAHYAAWISTNFIERARSKPWFDDTVLVFDTHRH